MRSTPCLLVRATLRSLETLLNRNKASAATDGVAKNPKIPWLPSQLAYVITCVDSRIEPAGFLGVDLGEATVQRTIGGRVTRPCSATSPTSAT